MGSNYEDEIARVERELAKHQQTIDRMYKIKDNLVGVSDRVLEKISNINELNAKREEFRDMFDHYRNKVAKMEAPGGESTSSDPVALEKYTRNQTKLDDSRTQFEISTTDMNQLLDKTEEKLHKVMIDLTIRFSKEIQLDFFSKMKQTF